MVESKSNNTEKCSPWTLWTDTSEVGIKERSRICGDEHHCPIQLENKANCTAVGTCAISPSMILLIIFIAYNFWVKRSHRLKINKIDFRRQGSRQNTVVKKIFGKPKMKSKCHFCFQTYVFFPFDSFIGFSLLSSKFVANTRRVATCQIFNLTSFNQDVNINTKILIPLKKHSGIVANYFNLY